MTTIRFTYTPVTRQYQPPMDGYQCSEPGDQSGDYFKVEDVRELVAACQAILDWDQREASPEVSGEWSQLARNMRAALSIATKPANAEGEGT